MGIDLEHDPRNFFDYVIKYNDGTKKGDYIDMLTRKDLVELYELIKEELEI